ncbi:MAG: DEAD/DEAH box helicase, partial [Oligoflexia bacterium]|nr:DEAD/DEAH box helicase [Oligoflexia bacterium]
NKLNQEDDYKSLAIYASILFLQGKSSEALTYFNMAYKMGKRHYLKHLGTRKFFFEDIEGIYFLLVLIADKGSENLKIAKDVLKDAAVKSENNSQLTLLLKYFQELVVYLDDNYSYIKGNTIYYDNHSSDHNHPIYQILSLLIGYWIDRDSLKKEGNNFKKLFSSSYKHFPGFARILTEIVVSLFTEKSEIEKFGIQEYQNYQQYLLQTKDMYAISFLNIVPIKEYWEMSLDALEKLYPESAENNIFEVKSFTADGYRLLWLIHTPSSSVIGVLEQKMGKKGQWSKGRPVSLERLAKGGPDLDYVTEKDKKVMATIGKHQVSTYYGYYHKEEYSFSQEKALEALIGHPNVIDSDTNTPLELLKGSVDLLVLEKDNNWVVSLSVEKGRSSTILQAEIEGSNRYRVIHFNEEALRLSQILGSNNKLVIPASGKERLQLLLKPISAKIPVQSNVAYYNHNGENNEKEINESVITTEADTTLNVTITPLPLGNGITIKLFFRPFGNEGPYFRPGQGLQVQQALINGKFLRVQRNLQEERQLALRLISSIEQLSMTNKGNDEWIFEELDEALDVINALQLSSSSLPIKCLWPSGQKYQISAGIGPQNMTLKISERKGEKGSSAAQWFSLEGKLQIDEEQVIELKTLLDLLDSTNNTNTDSSASASTSRFVKMGERSFIALTEHFKRQLAELKTLTEQNHGKIGFHPLSSYALKDLFDEVNKVGKFSSDKKWIKLKEKLLNAEKYNPSVPSTLQAELRDYQVEGVQWLLQLAHWEVGACLADDMGLGKTVQALALILEYASKGPVLVVAPTSVCHNWVQECNRFAPDLEVILHAQERNVERISALTSMQLLVTSYGLLVQDCKIFEAVNWQVVILDEAQSIKNANTKRAHSAMQLSAKIRVVLTGTPIENRLSELWSLFRFINPGLLGSFESFTKRFIRPIEERKDPIARSALKKLIRPFILRRLKSQVLEELPSRTEKTIVVPFDSKGRAFYEALREKALEKISDLSSSLSSSSAESSSAGEQQNLQKMRIHILAEITRLRRCCCHPALVMPDVEIPSCKLQAVWEILEELLQNHHRALVFSQFVGFLEKVQVLLKEKGVTYQYLDGSTSLSERKKRVDAFQSGQGELFLISLRAGGMGVNLTAADYVVHLDPWWNPAVEDQASDRAHRIGQTRPVTIYRVVMEGSIEEKILKLHQNKRDIANDLLDGTDLSGKLNNEELLALLKGNV